MSAGSEQECVKKEKSIKIKNGWYYLILAAIVFLVAFIRLFKLTDLPYGIHIDEAGLGVNAYSLANFGVDRYLNSYPIYPANFDGGQSPFYSYLVAFFIKFLWGGKLDLMVVRLPMVLVSLLAFGAGFYMLKGMLNRKWQVLGAFVYAVLPYFMMQCRFGLDCNAWVSMLTVSLAFLFLAMEKDKYYLYLLFGIIWGITYYTYALSYIANTVTLLFISVYLLYTRKAQIDKLLLTWISAFVVAIPLVAMVIINTFNLPDVTIGKISIFKLEHYRGGQIGIKPELIWENFLTILKCIFFKDGINYSSFDGFYTMYIISIPFFVVGFVFLFVKLIQSIRKKALAKECIFLLVFLAQFISGILLSGGSVPQIHRLNGIFFAQFIIVLYGIYAVVKGVCKLIKKEWKYLEHSLIGIVAVAYLVSFLLFAKFYFFEYKDAIYPQMLYSDQYTYTLEKLEEIGLGDVPTYVEASIVYYQFSTQMNPYDLYNTPDANMGGYLNNYFYMPEIQKGNVYIFRKEDTNRINEAVDKGLELLWEDRMWRVYY